MKIGKDNAYEMLSVQDIENLMLETILQLAAEGVPENIIGQHSVAYHALLAKIEEHIHEESAV